MMSEPSDRSKAAVISIILLGMIIFSVLVIMKSSSDGLKDGMGVIIGLIMLFYSGIAFVNLVKIVFTGTGFACLEGKEKEFLKKNPSAK